MSGDAVGRLRAAAERVLKAAVAFQVADARLAKGKEPDYLRFDKAQKAYALALSECAPALADAVLALLDYAGNGELSDDPWQLELRLADAAAALLPDDAP